MVKNIYSLKLSRFNYNFKIRISIVHFQHKMKTKNKKKNKMFKEFLVVCLPFIIK